MDGKRAKGHVLTLGLLLLAGCTTGTNGLLGPQGHKLMDTAKALRQPPSATLSLPRELEKQPLPAYVVEPGDVLLVQPADIDSPVRLPGDQPVLPDGTINLGKYGQLLVAGKTVAEIELMVRAAVQAQTKDAGFITVRLVSRQSKVYYVLGEVNAPGAFQLNGRETVLDGLMAAGGLNDKASRVNIILSRPTLPNHCRVVLPVCYREIVQLGDTTTNYQLAPGDRIYVPTRTCLQGLLPKCFEKSPCACGPQEPCAIGPTIEAHPPEHSSAPPPVVTLPLPSATPVPTVIPAPTPFPATVLP